MANSRFSFLYSSYPKEFLVPFIALVLFFSIIFFVIINFGISTAGFVQVEQGYSYFNGNIIYVWLVSSIIAVIFSMYYLGKLCGLCSGKLKKPKKKAKEEMGVMNLFGVFVLGAPFGLYIGGFMQSPYAYGAIAHENFAPAFVAVVLVSLIAWGFSKKAN